VRRYTQKLWEEGRKTEMLYYGLLLVFFFEYVRPIRYISFLYPIHLNSVIPVVVSLFSLKNSKSIKNIDFLRLSNTKIIIVFLFLIGAGILWADVKHYVFWKFIQVLGWFLIYFAIIKNVDGKKRLEGIFIVLVLCHFILLILTPDVLLHPEIRTYISQESFLGDGNDFYLSLNIIIPLCIYLCFSSESKSMKLLLLLLTLLFILAVIGTSSRGGSVALAAVIFYQWLKGRNKWVGLASMAILLFIVLLFAPPLYLERMGSIQDYEMEGSAQGRIMAWKSAIRMAADHPLTGVGAGHFPVKYGIEYRPPGVGRTEIPWANAHSLYFLVLGELGIPGLLVYLGLIVPNLWRNEKIIRSLKPGGASDSHSSDRRLFVCLNSSMIGFAVGGAFLSATYYPHVFVLAGVMEAGRHACLRRQKNDANVLSPTIP
jgi:probable O-glycosylation ligase (exosortase A-associated)